MTITIPEDIEPEFLQLLDLAQCSVRNDILTRREKKCVKFIRDLLGDDCSSPIDDEFNDGKVG